MEFYEDLPSRSIREDPIDWETAKEQLVANPGLWGLMATNVASSTAGQLRKGGNKSFRAEELDKFEFRVRKPVEAEGYGPRRTDLYGRYIGA